MNRIVILELTKVDNSGKKLRIGIPLLEIKEIKEIPNSDYCLINGYEINIGFLEVISIINLDYKKEK